MLVSQDLKEEYMYEMHALKEENMDVSYSLEVLNEFDGEMKITEITTNNHCIFCVKFYSGAISGID